MSKKENPFSVYARISQLAFVIIAPLLFFIGGGSYIKSKYDLPDWFMLLCVAIGLVTMISGAASYLYQIIKHYEKADKPAPKAFTSSRRNNDYYDDYRDLRK